MRRRSAMHAMVRWAAGLSAMAAPATAAPQRPASGPDSVVWRADSAGSVQFDFSASLWNRHLASAAPRQVDDMRQRLAGFVAAITAQPQLTPPAGFRAVFSAALLPPASDSLQGPLAAVMAFGAYPFMERLPFGGRFMAPHQMPVTDVLEFRVNPPADFLPSTEGRSFVVPPRPFRAMPRLTGRMGPFVVVDGELLVLTNHPSPASFWRTVPLARVLTEQRRVTLAWRESWMMLRPDWRDAVQLADRILADIDGALLALTPEQARAPACRMPGNPSTTPDRFVASGVSPGTDCTLVGELNADFLRRDVPRAELQVVVVRGFAPCLARQADPGLFRPSGDLPCRAILDLLAGADWERVRRTLATMPTAP